MEEKSAPLFRGAWSPSISGASNNPWQFVPPPAGPPPSGPPPSYPPQSGPMPSYGHAPRPYIPQQPPNSLVGVVCNNFTKLWDNKQTKKKMKREISFFRVEVPEGYHRLGDMAEANTGPYPSGAMLVVRESNPSSSLPLLAPPLRYVKIWDDHGTGAKFGDVKILRPVAPAGYVALGDISWPNHHSEPPLDYMRCVHASVCMQGKWLEPDLWNDIGAGARNGDLSIWLPVPDPEVGGSAINTFVSTSNYHPPKPNERPAWVLIGPRAQ